MNGQPITWPRAAAAALVLLAAACGASTPPPVLPAGPERVVIERRGAPADVRPSLHGPSLLLQGSGRPLTDAFLEHAAQVAEGPVDVVVLSASLPSGSSRTPECDVVVGLAAVNSCTTITVRSPEGAGEARVHAAIDRAEIVYFAGGNQCDYVRWQGSQLHDAVRRLHARGGGVGGGSAGLAIQGELVYDGCEGSTTSGQALADPYHASISFTRGFFSWAPMRGVLTDSHFVERDRMGRLLAFLARHLAEGQTGRVLLGLGVDGGAAVVVDRHGEGTVFGGPAFVVHAAGAPERIVPGEPVTARGFRVQRLDAGSRYSFADPDAAGAYLRDVVAGVIRGEAYVP
jgi:cyanophycinase-like exopeptidase